MYENFPAQTDFKYFLGDVLKLLDSEYRIIVAILLESFSKGIAYLNETYYW